MFDKAENPLINRHETTRRQLAYTEDFKDLISRNPGIIASFRKIESEIKDKLERWELKAGDVFSEGKLTVTNLFGESCYGSYLKAEIDDHKFFIKRIPGFNEIGLGYEEFNSIVKAKELLKDCEYAEVIDFKLGYQDDKGLTYFVSGWEDYITVEKYIATADVDEINEIIQSIYEIQCILRPHFVDVDKHNILYSRINKKFFVFDIHERVERI